jgi:hypothetical protein
MRIKAGSGIHIRQVGDDVSISAVGLERRQDDIVRVLGPRWAPIKITSVDSTESFFISDTAIPAPCAVTWFVGNNQRYGFVREVDGEKNYYSGSSANAGDAWYDRYALSTDITFFFSAPKVFDEGRSRSYWLNPWDNPLIIWGGIVYRWFGSDTVITMVSMQQSVAVTGGSPVVQPAYNVIIYPNEEKVLKSKVDLPATANLWIYSKGGEINHESALLQYDREVSPTLEVMQSDHAGNIITIKVTGTLL